MTIKIVYNESCQVFKNQLVAYLWEHFPKIDIETYDESYYKDKKKAIMIKSSCGARLTPFIAIYNNNKDLIKAFYSEVRDCTLNNVIEYVNESN